MRFEDHGTVVLIRPESDADRAWLAENVEHESWQLVGDAIACEPRLAADVRAAHAAQAADRTPRTWYRVEVVADTPGEWVGNGLTFATREQAEEYARDLASRWTAVRKRRVVEAPPIEDD